MLGVRQDRVEHRIDMKYIGEQDTIQLGWSTVMLEDKDGQRIQVNCMTGVLREMQLQPGDLVEVLIDKMDHAVWMLDRMKPEQYTKEKEEQEKEPENVKQANETQKPVEDLIKSKVQEIEAKKEEEAKEVAQAKGEKEVQKKADETTKQDKKSRFG